MALAAAFVTALGLKEAAGPVGGLLEAAADLLFDGAGKAVLEDVHGRLRAYVGRIPLNHDLEHSIRLAELTASLVLLESYRKQEELDRFDQRAARPPPFIAAAQTWLYHQLGLAGDFKVKSNEALIAEIEQELDAVLASRDRAALRDRLHDAERQAWTELTSGAASRGGGEPPPGFAELFLGEEADKPGWSLVFEAFIREAMKKNPRAQVAFVTTRLASLRVELARFEPKLDAIRGDLAGLPDTIVAKLMAALDARGETRRAETAGLERRTIIELARRLRPDEGLDFDQAIIELENAVKIALDVIARGERGTNFDAFVDTVLARVAEKTKYGDFDAGARAVDDALAELDRREAEQRDLARRSRIALLEAGVEQDVLRRDATGVARRIETIIATEQPNECPAWAPAYRKRYDRYYEDGRDRGINFSLSIAAEVASRMLASARNSDERWQSRILAGNALAMLGERESGTVRLDAAVVTFRAALQERTRERAPLDWAATQNNLGNALRTLGARESGTIHLKEAVAAYGAALKEHSRERVPLSWAATQTNLGLAFQTLGTRETGTARLEEAVATFRAALQERTRERVPLDWAVTQNNLGLALRTLADRESGTDRLWEAVAAFRAALEEQTRERVPLAWAMTQNNLGGALTRLGQRESGTDRLWEAVAAFRAGLEERTRERVPLAWAMTQHNLGSALQTLGERESGAARLWEAVAALRAALEERTRERVPLAWAATQYNLGNVLRRLDERESGTTRLEEAVAAYRAALQERTRERVPLDWAMTQNNLGAALQTLGQRESGTARLEEAVAAFDAALGVFEPAQAEHYTERCRANRDTAAALLAARKA